MEAFPAPSATLRLDDHGSHEVKVLPNKCISTAPAAQLGRWDGGFLVEAFNQLSDQVKTVGDRRILQERWLHHYPGHNPREHQRVFSAYAISARGSMMSMAR